MCSSDLIIRGENHYPQDIEETASACHPALADGNTGAFALEVDGEERLGIVCEVSRGAIRGLDADEVFETLRRTISSHHDLQLAAAALIRPGSLPRTPSGKVRRFACRAGLVAKTLPIVALWEARLGAGELAPTGGTRWLDELREAPRARREGMLRLRLQEELTRLAGLPAGELPPSDVGFFDLGLDSVAVVNFGAILERELGLRPEPTLMFEYPTLSALAAHIAETVLADAKVGASVKDEPGAKTIADQPRTDDVSATLAAEIAALQRLLDADPVESRSPLPHASSGKRTDFADSDSR